MVEGAAGVHELLTNLTVGNDYNADVIGIQGT